MQTPVFGKLIADFAKSTLRMHIETAPLLRKFCFNKTLSHESITKLDKNDVHHLFIFDVYFLKIRYE